MERECLLSSQLTYTFSYHMPD